MLRVRDCGGCHVCCVYSEIEDMLHDYFKPVYEACKYLDTERQVKKCTVYTGDLKPKACTSYLCSWMRGFGTDSVDDRPDNSGIIMAFREFNGGKWIVVNELKPDAVMTTGRNILVAVAKRVDFPAIISDYDSRPPHDLGDRVGIRKDREHRATTMLGEHLGALDGDEFYNVYKLRHMRRVS